MVFAVDFALFPALSWHIGKKLSRQAPIFAHSSLSLQKIFGSSTSCRSQRSCAVGGKSGQHRASYFLTGSHLRGWSNVTENNRHLGGKGEKAR